MKPQHSITQRPRAQQHPLRIVCADGEINGYHPLPPPSPDPFPRMATLLPAVTLATAKIVHMVISEDESTRTFMRAVAHCQDYHTRPGTYAVLYLRPTDTVHPDDAPYVLPDGFQLMMSDADMERRSNLEAWKRAHGNVLVFGLGLGMLTTAIVARPSVRHITVIERNPDVIAAVWPHVQHPKLSVVRADAFTFEPHPSARFNMIWSDIWPTIAPDNFIEMEKLRTRYLPFVDRTDRRAWFGHWTAREMAHRLNAKGQARFGALITGRVS
jgi:hypothetical protein